MTRKKMSVLKSLRDGKAMNLTSIGLECGQEYDRAASWASDAVTRLARDGFVTYSREAGACITEKGKEIIA